MNVNTRDQHSSTIVYLAKQTQVRHSVTLVRFPYIDVLVFRQSNLLRHIYFILYLQHIVNLFALISRRYHVNKKLTALYDILTVTSARYQYISPDTVKPPHLAGGDTVRGGTHIGAFTLLIIKLINLKHTC